MTHRRGTVLYLGSLLFFIGLGDPTGLLSLPLLFTLKDRLHAGPGAVALFEAASMMPVYGAVFFGLLRDRWSPFDRRDRGYLALAAPAALGCYLWLATRTLDYSHLLIGVTAAMTSYQMLDVAAGAIVTTIAKREAATGSLSALWETVETVVRIISVLTGGWLVLHLSMENIFLIAAVLTLPVFAQAFLNPTSVLTPERARESEHSAQDFRQLLSRLRPESSALWPVAVTVFLYSFSPGWGTPLLYYLTDEVHLSSQVFGMCRAVQHGGVLAAAALYGALYQHLQFRSLLIGVITVNIVPAFCYLLIRETSGALLVSTFIGLCSGISTVAVFDLLMRCCPHGLEGAGTALGHSAFGVASAFGDVVGSTIYAHGGFLACLVVDAIATAAIVPILLRLPATVTTRIESQPSAVLS